MPTDWILNALGMDDRQRMYIGYQFRKLARRYSRTIEGTTANFRIETLREYRRIRTLMHEEDVLADLLREVSSDDVFYDIGANIGVYSCFVGQHVDRVIAVEPHGRTATRLRENLAGNDLDAEVYEYALADSTDSVPLSHPRRSPSALGTGEFSLVSYENSISAERVDVISGDELIRREHLPAPTVVKIDVEGAELRTLDGLRETLPSCRIAYVEVHHDHVAIEDVLSELASLGLRAEVFRNRGNTSFVKATDDGSSSA